jgi:two-component sensor histidine kinase
LPRIAMPKYFSLFETESIIISNDAMHDPKTVELKEFYLSPNNIGAMMDIPIRIEGEMIGVLCFEHIGEPRIWQLRDQQFGLITAQMISLSIESYEKKKSKNELETAVRQKEILLKEVHHRVKNNFSIISSLVSLQGDKAKDVFHKDLFQDTKNRLLSIATVHENLYRSKTFSEINFKSFLLDVLKKLSDSFSHPDKKVLLKADLRDVDIDVSYAIPLSLIVNELVTNCYKHAFEGRATGTIEIELDEHAGEVSLRIKDDGIGMYDAKGNKNSLGLDIYRGLLAQINAKDTVTKNGGTEYLIEFQNR